MSHKVHRYRGPALSLMLAALSLSWPATGLAQGSPETTLVGAWEVYKDDDRPGEEIAAEFMNFRSDGRFTIVRSDPDASNFEGLYRTNGNVLQFLIKQGDQAIPMERQFALSADELKFKNSEKGWVYYKRIGAQPDGDAPDL